MAANTVEQLEKNISVSFSYVKKDLLMVNDSISNVHDKIQHLSLNHAMLLEKMANLEKRLAEKKQPAKKQNELIVGKKIKFAKEKKALSFLDLKSKKKFSSFEYTIKTIKGRKFAVAKSPSGNKAYRIISSKTTSKKVKPRTQKKTIKTRKTISKTPKKVVTETVLYE